MCRSLSFFTLVDNGFRLFGMCQDVDDHYSGVRERARHLANPPHERERVGGQAGKRSVIAARRRFKRLKLRVALFYPWASC